MQTTGLHHSDFQRLSNHDSNVYSKSPIIQDRKILFVCSALDLTIPFGTTPAWWQLLKALYEEGVDVIATPFRGRAIQSFWWRCYENPCFYTGELYQNLVSLRRRLRGKKESSSRNRELVVAKIASRIVKPRWKDHIRNILSREKNVEAVVFLQLPLNQLNGLASWIQDEFRIPVIYYDGDLPVSLPSYGGFTFNAYVGADISEYDGFLVNSAGSIPILNDMGAQSVNVLHWGVDPTIFFPLQIPKDIDVFFSGMGKRYRQNWVNEMIDKPSSQLNIRIVASGLTSMSPPNGGVRTVHLPSMPFSQWVRYCCRSRVALNIARDSHAMTAGTSSSRPFELASLGCCIVSNPYLGLREWFDLGKEIFVVADWKEAVDMYSWLLDNDEARTKAEENARRRVLREHTSRHRARQLLAILSKLS